MSKIIELTVEIDVQRVSCPGVWLCQDGHVRLTVFALGTTYQTCLLPPVFPLMYKDVFYFKKRFQENCAINNICCLLKDETIYCELVQWTEDCMSSQYVILAQYLGAMNDVLFPPNMCTSDGVDLLMRRSKHFPGILSPKIEIATKVRIDEVWSQRPSVKMESCNCVPREEPLRQDKVCHSARYHRCGSRRNNSPSRSRSRSRSESRSFCNESQKIQPQRAPRCYPSVASCRPTPRRAPSPCRPSPCQSPRSRSPKRCRQFCVYNVQTGLPRDQSQDDVRRTSADYVFDSPDQHRLNDDRMRRVILESHHIEYDKCNDRISNCTPKKAKTASSVAPCICEICKRYHQLFHADISQ